MSTRQRAQTVRETCTPEEQERMQASIRSEATPMGWPQVTVDHPRARHEEFVTRNAEEHGAHLLAVPIPLDADGGVLDGLEPGDLGAAEWVRVTYHWPKPDLAELAHTETDES